MADEHDTTVEAWAPTPGHEGYEASDQGRIRSTDRKVWCGTHYRFWKGRVLKPWAKKWGYLSVYVSPQKARGVHVLVMRTFVGPPPLGTEVCHSDGNPNNNRLSNLRYDTRRNNYADSIKHGTAARGARFPHTRLTSDDVRAIRNSKLSSRELANRYGITQNYVGDIKRRYKRKWLDDVKNTEEQISSPRMDKGVD